MAKYFKVGKKASNFSDPYTGYNIAGHEVKAATTKQMASPKFKRALTAGHIVTASDKDFKNFKDKDDAAKKAIIKPEQSTSTKELQESVKQLSSRVNTVMGENENLKNEIEELKSRIPPEKALGDMDDPELVEFYKKNYEVEEKELKAFEKLSTKDKVLELKSFE